ncbi:MAG TPA: amino acid aminotransferase [Sphingomicrobium sp.]|nr:amino acid aminotransferase [Sphingomicrobium sp.]
MLDQQEVNARSIGDLAPVKSDSLLALIELAKADQRPEKIDVGVGVYRDGEGRTPILDVVKEAEHRLWESQESKAYLGGRGDPRFALALRPILLGEHEGDEAIQGLQTPGGCGALTLGFNLVRTANPGARVLIGTPTWPNHVPIISGSGLEIVEYCHYDRNERKLCFGEMLETVKAARPGDVVLLHGCCHNPTGADLNADQWAEVTGLIAERGLLPLIDIAYQGLGEGLEPDGAGLRSVLAACDSVIIAQSCDKNFGVYRDRVGSLWIKTANPSSTATAMGHVLKLAREMWSMPPDHAAAAIRIVLEDAKLNAGWRSELETMRERILGLRRRLAAADPLFDYIAEQKGMFSMLPLTPEQVLKLRGDHAIYMADSGRFNICGMGDGDVDRFASAVLEVIGG